MRQAIAVGLFVLLGWTGASAQTLTAVLKADEPFTISFGHPVTSGESFRWWCGNAIVKNITTTELKKSTERHTDGGWTFEVLLPGLKAGTHTCQISAYNAAGETKSEPITITVSAATPGTAPPPPVRLKIVIVLEVGK